MGLYLLKSSLALLLFLAVYELFLRKDTFFRRNRMYLLLSLIGSMILPLIHFPDFFSLFREEAYPSAEAGLPYLTVGLKDAVTAAYQTEPGRISLSLMNGLVVVYLAGVIFVLGRLLSQALYLWKLARQADVQQVADSRVYFHTGSISHFSLFHLVFLNRRLISEQNGEISSILAHEQVHIRHWHSLDLLLAEAVTIILWFNPFLWLYRFRIQEVLEFIADREVLDTGCERAEYQAILVNQALGIPVFSITSKFNQVQLKKRITMLSKIKSSPLAHLKALAVIPVFLVVIMLSSWKNQSSNANEKINVSGKVVAEADGNPLSGAAVIISGTTIGTVTDQEGAFKIETAKGDQLVISFVGFETAVVSARDEKPMLVKMKRNVVSLEEGSVSPGNSDGKANTVTVVASNKESLYIIDGKEVAFSEVNGLDPEKIEQINVLKNEEAVKKYGEKGKDGVVLIRLKKELAVPVENQSKQDTARKSGELFTIVEQMPEFPGGNEAFREFINMNLRYPEEAVKKGMQGKVFVCFTVDVNGKVKDAKVVRGVDPLFDVEALRVINLSPAWKPGIQRGKPVDVSFTMPVQFSLNNKNEVFTVVEEMPMFQGGTYEKFREYIVRNITYPVAAKSKKIQEQIFVQFVVSPEGKVVDAKILRGNDPDLCQEALRVVNSSPDWKPGKQRGKEVAVQFTFPIEFKLQ
jgi:TonB family protein